MYFSSYQRNKLSENIDSKKLRYLHYSGIDGIDKYEYKEVWSILHSPF